MATPVRKPHVSTSDLLTWPETPSSDSSHRSSVPAPRSHQPSEGMGKALFGGRVTDEEAQFLNKKKPCSGYKLRKPCSGYKLKEMTGSGIFAANGENNAPESDATNRNDRTSVRVYQQAMNRISQISFSVEETVPPKKLISIPEVAKQRDLSGSLQTESNSKTKKQISDAKIKEIRGHGIFSPASEIRPQSSSPAYSLESKENKDIGEPAPRNLHTSVKNSNPAGGQGQSNNLLREEPVAKTSKKIHNQKLAELTGNNIFKGDVPPGSAEKPLRNATLREMGGSNIFADEKAGYRDYLRGVRKPPGGESSISLV